MMKLFICDKYNECVNDAIDNQETEISHMEGKAALEIAL